MPKKLIYCLCLFTSGAITTAYADVFYCQPKLATGFYKKDGEWRQANFNGERFTIKFSEDLTSMKISGDGARWSCEASWQGRLEEYRHILLCVPGYRNGKAMQFNSKTLRYHRSITSVASWTSDNEDTSAIEIGTCEKF